MKKIIILPVLTAVMILPVAASGDKEVYPSETINTVSPQKLADQLTAVQDSLHRLLKNTGKMQTLLL